MAASRALATLLRPQHSKLAVCCVKMHELLTFGAMGEAWERAIAEIDTTWNTNNIAGWQAVDSI